MLMAAAGDQEIFPTHDFLGSKRGQDKQHARAEMFSHSALIAKIRGILRKN